MPTYGEKQQAHDDRTAFHRLRNYYRLRFKNGSSDECFLNWVELMCEREREQPTPPPMATTGGTE
jgi:hypothetical protein